MQLSTSFFLFALFGVSTAMGTPSPKKSHEECTPWNDEVDTARVQTAFVELRKSMCLCMPSKVMLSPTKECLQTTYDQWEENLGCWRKDDHNTKTKARCILKNAGERPQKICSIKDVAHRFYPYMRDLHNELGKVNRAEKPWGAHYLHTIKHVALMVNDPSQIIVA